MPAGRPLINQHDGAEPYPAKPEWPEGELEARIGIAPLEQLQDERRTLVNRSAILAARHGNYGTYDAERKIMLSALKATLRAQAVRDKVKVTEGSLDEDAHAHADYRDFITASTKERAEWIKTDRQIQDITERINRGQMLGRYAAMEPRT